MSACENLIDTGGQAEPCGRPARYALTYEGVVLGLRHRARVLLCDRCEPAYENAGLTRIERLGLDHPFSGARPGWGEVAMSALRGASVVYRPVPGGGLRGDIRRATAEGRPVYVARRYDGGGVLLGERLFDHAAEAAEWVEGRLGHPYVVNVD